MITEAILRDELRANKPKVYYIPDGKILSPAAKDYLQQLKVIIKKQEDIEKMKKQEDTPDIISSCKENKANLKAKYVDYESGAFYYEKPEYMTQLVGNKLVSKASKRIVLRGKVDSLQSLIVLAQAEINEKNCNQQLLDDLDDVLKVLREIMRGEVLDKPIMIDTIIGLTHAELREQSHYPEKYFNVKQMMLPTYKMGKEYALLNRIRTTTRECEAVATDAFKVGQTCSRTDILQTFNRLSSTLHIMMCKYYAGYYK
ncbi:MAG: ATP-binding protein [Oscillospiraceae bacterium]